MILNSVCAAFSQAILYILNKKAHFYGHSHKDQEFRAYKER